MSENISDKVVLKCPKCASFRCDQLQLKLGRQVYKCMDCGRSFYEKYKRTFLEKPPAELNCPNPNCKSKNLTGSGRESRTGKRRYRCKDCQKIFSGDGTREFLEKPLPEVRCPKHSCKSDNIAGAGRCAHTGKRRYRCKECNRRFVENPTQICAYNNLPKGINAEQMYEMDYWDMRILGFEPSLNDHTYTVNFITITQDWLKSAAKKWIKFCATRDCLTTLDHKISAIKTFSNFLKLRYPDLPASKISRSLVVDYFCWLLEQKTNPSSRKKKISGLKQFLEACARFDWTDIVKESLVFDDDYPKRASSLPRFIPQEVLEQLDCNLDALPEPIARMVMVVREVGMRVSELCNLKFDCIHQDVQGSWWLIYERFKSKDEHSVPIRPEIATVIQEQQQYIRKSLDLKFPKLFCGAARTRYVRDLKYQQQIGESNYDNQLELFKHFVPLAEAINPATLRAYLHGLARLKSIKDQAGNIFPLGRIHQFRHTKGTDMINNGVPIEHVKRFLGHESFSMTMTYAHIHDKTLKSAMEKFWDGNRVVNIAGEVLQSTNPNLETTDMQFFKKNILAQALSNGYCGRPLIKGSCPHANACLTCGDFRTTREFLGIHKSELKHTDQLIEQAKANGWQRQVEMNEQVKKNLSTIIQTLEGEDSEQGKES